MQLYCAIYYISRKAERSSLSRTKVFVVFLAVVLLALAAGFIQQGAVKADILIAFQNGIPVAVGRKARLSIIHDIPKAGKHAVTGDFGGNSFDAVEIVFDILIIVQSLDVRRFDRESSDRNKASLFWLYCEEGILLTGTAKQQGVVFDSASSQKFCSRSALFHLFQVQVAAIGKINFHIDRIIFHFFFDLHK